MENREEADLEAEEAEVSLDIVKKENEEEKKKTIAKYARGKPLPTKVLQVSLLFLTTLQKVKNKNLKKAIKKSDRRSRDAAESAAKAELLLTQEAG